MRQLKSKEGSIEQARKDDQLLADKRGIARGALASHSRDEETFNRRSTQSPCSSRSSKPSVKRRRQSSRLSLRSTSNSLSKFEVTSYSPPSGMLWRR